MAGKAPRRVYRVAGNARRLLAPLLLMLLIATVYLFMKLAQVQAWDWPGRVAAVAFLLIAFWVLDRGLGTRIVGWVSDRAVKNDMAWAVISRSVAAERRTRAAFARLFATLPFRLLAPLALPLGIVLTAAMTYRLVAFPALIARETGGSGLETAVLALDWLLFGLGYGLIGLAAPLVTLLLLLRRRRSSLGAAMALHFLGLFGMCLVGFRAIMAVILAESGSEAPAALLFHPLLATPDAGGFLLELFSSLRLVFCEALANILAAFLLWRPRVWERYDDQPANPPGAGSSPASEAG